MQRVVDWFHGWFRRHPLLALVWVLFLALCIFATFAGEKGDRPNVIYGIVVLPLLGALVILYFSRTVERFQKIRTLTGRSGRQAPPQHIQDHDDHNHDHNHA
jgi:fucose 4-O-acetylase-like acetyltransferase